MFVIAWRVGLLEIYRNHSVPGWVILFKAGILPLRATFLFSSFICVRISFLILHHIN